MKEIKLGTGEYAITYGVIEGVNGIIIERVESGVVGESAENSIGKGNADSLIITFSNEKSALVLIEQIAKSLLP